MVGKAKMPCFRLDQLVQNHRMLNKLVSKDPSITRTKNVKGIAFARKVKSKSVMRTTCFEDFHILRFEEVQVCERICLYNCLYG